MKKIDKKIKFYQKKIIKLDKITHISRDRISF